MSKSVTELIQRLCNGISDGSAIIRQEAANALKLQAARITELERASAASPQAPAVDGAETHSDDMAVNEFARVMKDKMAAARAKGRGGWEQCAPAVLSDMLRKHVEKGDPRDVANFCMMLWHLNAPIAAAPLIRVAATVALTEPAHPEISPLEIGAPGNDPYSNLAAAAQAALNLIQVCIEGDGDTTDEGDMLRSALKIAALPHSTTHLEGQIAHLVDCVREDVLAHDGKLAARSQLAENRLKLLIGLALKSAASPAAESKTLPRESEAPIAKTLDDWHEDDGNVVWFTWQDGEWLGEPSYIGQPNDSDWPGYHTHWTPHPEFPAPIADAFGVVKGEADHG